MKTKNILCSVILLFVISSFVSPCLTFANNEELYDTYEECLDYGENSKTFEKTGVLPEKVSYNELDFYIGDTYSESSESDMQRSLPSYVDLSTDVCFPDLGNQHSLMACVAFATTYYQFSYEVNKLNGITSASDRIVYSPKWTYNFINGGSDSGASMSDAYTVLNKYGALKISDLPFDYDYSWLPGNKNLNSNEMIPQRIEALKTKVSSFGTITLPNYGTAISNPNDVDLYEIKSLLNNGKVLVIATHDRFNYKSGVDCNNSTIYVNYRCYDTPFSHAMAVVGYDDGVWCDVNENGVRESCEMGAFKCADSYGSSGTYNDTNGYRWILYDALNAISANSFNSWEVGIYGTRIQAFKAEVESPTFFYINVEKKDVYYIGEIDINTGTQPLSNCQYKMGRALKYSSSVSYSDDMLPIQSTGAYNGKIFFDYGYFCENIKSYLNGYDWYVNFTSLNNSNYNFKVIDDLQNIIENYGSINNIAKKSVSISTRIGDANIDGAMTMADANLIQSYDAGVVNLSTLQNVLADFNENGIVTISDAVAIMQSLITGNS